LASDQHTIALWNLGSKRCHLTSIESGPPFVVILYDGEARLTEREFDDHDEAAACAIEALREAADDRP
jgi:hypothetical protein